MADQNPDWAALGIDVTMPSVARIYDYALGGKNNFAVDRESAEGRGILPANRRFLGRAVEPLAEAGIRQFLDLEAGLPSQNNAHEAQMRVISGCPADGLRLSRVPRDGLAAAGPWRGAISIEVCGVRLP